jgi:hypothetical protein
MAASMANVDIIVRYRTHRRRMIVDTAHLQGKTRMTMGYSPRQHHLLAALPTPDFARLERNLKLVSLPLGAVLYESGIMQNHVYFPSTSIVSLLSVSLAAIES